MSAVTLPLPFSEPAPARVRPTVVRPAAPSPPLESTDRSKRKHRAVWLALHFDHLPLRAAVTSLPVAERPDVSAQPIAVTDDDQRRTIVACNSVAAEFGLRCGHSLNAAIALCAGTIFLARQLNHETELLQTLAQMCERFTPITSVQPPNELLLEVRGSFRLFGGIQNLLEEVRASCDERGAPACIAVSATSQSALWLARANRSAAIVPPKQLAATLSRLPVCILQWPADIELRLARFGVSSVGDLLRLPRGGLARRIGHARLIELDQAVGRHPQVRKRFQSPAVYRDRLALEFEIETTQLLGQFIARRLDRLEAFLTTRQLAVEHVVFDLRHREGCDTQFKIGLVSATANVAHVIKLMHERLAQIQLRAPVRDVGIRAERLRPAPTNSLPLFKAAGTADSIRVREEQQARLLEQLRSRLGEDSVSSVRGVADYRPERAHTVPAATVTQSSPNALLPGSLAPRPFWLLDQPDPIPLRHSRGRPSQLLCGPEIIEAGWWDSHPVMRAYFHARSPQGALAWICRDRSAPDAWHMHGLFG